MRADRPTERLAKGYQEGIHPAPVFCRELLTQDHFGLQRVFGGDITPDIHDSVDVSINTDCRLLKSHRDNQIGGFSAHPGQADQLLDSLRNATLKTFHLPCQAVEVAGLGPEKTNRMNQGGNLLFTEGGKPRQIWRLPEETGCSLGSHLIPGPRREDRRHQDLERVPTLNGDQVNHRHRLVTDCFGHHCEKSVNIGLHSVPIT